MVNVFCMELPLFLREHHNGMYRTDVYFLTKNLAEMPIFILIPLITLSISYFLIRLNPLVTKFLVAVGILELMTHTVISYGYFMSCSSPWPWAYPALSSCLSSSLVGCSSRMAASLPGWAGLSTSLGSSTAMRL